MLLQEQGIDDIEIVNLLARDHGFVVIGRNPDSDITKPETWGGTAVIVDSWYGETYPASELANHMGNKGTIPKIDRGVTRMD